MTTNQILDLVVKVEEPVFQLIDEIKTNEETQKTLKEGSKIKFVIALIKHHRTLIYDILARMDDVTIEEVANRDIQTNIQKIQDLVELKDFF